MSVSDREIVEAQLGRGLRSEADVVSRCHLGLPVVVRVPPILDDGTPFPTLYWLTCPLARRRIARIEGAGGVREYSARVATDPEFAAALAIAHSRYARDRDGQLGDHRPGPSGGVGGAAGNGVKCLHAHYAHTLGGGDNPIGAEMAARVEPLDCTKPCIKGGRIDPDWREP